MKKQFPELASISAKHICLKDVKVILGTDCLSITKPSEHQRGKSGEIRGFESVVFSGKENSVITHRVVFSVESSIFDTLGLTLPFTIRIRLVLRL